MTPTRWKVVTRPSGYIPSIVTDDDKEIHITQVAGYSRTDTQDLGNATQIVREHNAHEAMYKALNDFVRVNYGKPLDMVAMSLLIEQGLAALTLAKGSE